VQQSIEGPCEAFQLTCCECELALRQFFSLRGFSVAHSSTNTTHTPHSAAQHSTQQAYQD